MPESFHGSSLPSVMQRVRDTLGPDAMILRTAVRPGRGGDIVEIVAAAAPEVEALRARLDGPRVRRRDRGNRPEPYRIAFVGPPGGGKTTAVVKLALAARAAPRGGRPLGIITLDTWRAGAVDELGSYADAAGIPFEAADSLEEVSAAMESLARCDVILVDTPGCGPGTPEERRGWWPALRSLRPDEVHAVVPAGLRIEVAFAALETLAPLQTTHLLLSHLDSLPGDAGLAALARALDRPARWVVDSADPRRPVRPARGRILSALALDSDPLAGGVGGNAGRRVG